MYDCMYVCMYVVCTLIDKRNMYSLSLSLLYSTLFIKKVPSFIRQVTEIHSALNIIFRICNLLLDPALHRDVQTHTNFMEMVIVNE